MGSILHKRGTGVPAASALTVGELAIDQSTGKVYTKTSGGQVVEVGAGGGGGVGIKLASQPATWTSVEGRAFENTQKDGTSPIYPWPNNSDAYMAKGWTHTGETATLNVPAGKNFLLYGLTSLGVNQFELFLNSIKLDGEVIYPASGSADTIALQTSTNILKTWPAAPSPGTDIINNSLANNMFEKQPYIIENQLSFKSKSSSSNSVNMIIVGLFVKA